MLHKYVNVRGCEMIWENKNHKFYYNFSTPKLNKHNHTYQRLYKSNINTNFIVRIMQNHTLSIILQKMLISDNFTYIYLSYMNL